MNMISKQEFAQNFNSSIPGMQSNARVFTGMAYADEEIEDDEDLDDEDDEIEGDEEEDEIEEDEGKDIK
ncbi:hypothetical protein [Dyadobacter sp. CY351]|uniref:hypothetical protein n=1 Tax=Dyadobacter sp. CY351 TaxID=2909337 RepID=UPI001F38BA98|nr:hypothetical protein [Dyadobacter sp. CY351]MCF2518530.1 hypothetical protein [Dyadobacter sp. CY351]